MTSLKGDGGVHFFIGAICVASIIFNKGTTGVFMHTLRGNISNHANVSEAMKEMHRLLKSPAPEKL